MRTRRISLMPGLLFAGIFCLSSGVFGSFSHDHTGLSSEKAAGYDQRPSEVVFIDPSVQDAETIVAQLPENAEVVRLSPGMDGVSQITAHLSKKRNLSTVRIISHGNAGYFVLNGQRIDGDFLRDRGGRISAWGWALAYNGDILLYACNLAATAHGQTLVQQISGLTGADIAASTDITGGDIYHGNWILEYNTGNIETTILTITPDFGYKLDDPALYTWHGSQGSGWGNEGNWDIGVPGTGDAVEISGAGN